MYHTFLSFSLCFNWIIKIQETVSLLLKWVNTFCLVLALNSELSKTKFNCICLSICICLVVVLQYSITVLASLSKMINVSKFTKYANITPTSHILGPIVLFIYLLPFPPSTSLNPLPYYPAVTCGKMTTVLLPAQTYGADTHILYILDSYTCVTYIGLVTLNVTKLCSVTPNGYIL